MALKLSTNARITWCPGCPNGAILVAFRQAVEELVEQGKVRLENIVALSGIGCHGKITDYLNLNSFTSLHGRVIPTMTGVKCANPDLLVIGFSGDGDSFSEGLDHLLHAARRNSDIKLFLHNNQIFALTTGQVTALSPKGMKGKSTPLGSIEEPFDACSLVKQAGATFVARAYAGDIVKTKEVMLAAMTHKGFALVEIIQPCITFFDTRDYWQEQIKAGKVPLGIIHQETKPTFEEFL
jgi:2-oxoglutarate ferredoxin oxidoreductase subunit beta